MQSLDDDFQEEAESCADLLRAAWQGEGSASAADLSLIEEMLDLSMSGPDGRGAAALVPEEAVTVAVLTDGDRCVEADDEFSAWFPDPSASPALRRLTAQARRSGSALRVLELADGAVAAWAACGPGAQAWARSEAAREALAWPGRVLVLIFAPSRSSELKARASAAFGLTPLESRLAEALLFAPSLQIAADQIGIGRETARDALARIMAKVDVRRSTDLVRRISELMSGARAAREPDAAMLTESFGLTRAEAAVALKLSLGATQRAAAEALGLQPETVRTYAKSALAKVGVARAKDLARLTAETYALSTLVAAAEPVFTSGAPAAVLRLMPRQADRRLAFLDYGPRSGRPAIVFHGFVAGRSLPPALARALQARGLRPIVPQRPGFGLTSPTAGDYLTDAAEDLEALIAAIGGEEVHLFARDGGTAAALAFADAHPGRVARGVLLNPRPPGGLAPGHRSGPVARMTAMILRQPHLIEGLGDFIRRHTRSDYLEASLRQTLHAIPADAAALESPAVRAQLVRDIQAQFAHTGAGYAAEHALYARGWRPPGLTGGGSWAVVHPEALVGDPPHAPWSGLPGVSFHRLPAAGVLAQFTHAEDLAALIHG